jgi:7-cyano-7-deazaguanine reductase
VNEPMLGRVVEEVEYGTLDTFPVDTSVTCTFESAELQALCPAVPYTQPDIYDMKLVYRAVSAAIESKSLKLWLVTFRDRAVFAEHLAAEIGATIDAVEGVEAVSVSLRQNIRGGLQETVLWERAD